MNQMLLLVSVLIALFLMSTKEGKKVAKDVSKSVSSVAGQKGKGGFPSGIVLILVLVALLCLSRKGLVEGQNSDQDNTLDNEQESDAPKADMNECVEAVDGIKVMLKNLNTRLDSIPEIIG